MTTTQEEPELCKVFWASQRRQHFVEGHGRTVVATYLAQHDCASPVGHKNKHACKCGERLARTEDENG